MNAARVRILEGLLDRVVQRAGERRAQAVVSAPAHLAVVDDAADGLDINLVDDFPSSTALPIGDIHDAFLADDRLGDSASRLIATDAPMLEVEPPPRHTPPPESGPLRTPPGSGREAIEGDLAEPTSLLPRQTAQDVEVRHIQADLSALRPTVLVRGSLKKARFVDALDATLGLKP